MSLDFTVFDLETQKFSSDVPGGFKNLKDFGMSCAVTFTEKDGYKHYFHNDVDSLMEQLKKANLVVGFNLKNFDYKVLSGYTDYNFDNIPTFDILEEIFNSLGHRVKLNMLALANFGSRPEGNLLKSVNWYKQGDTTKVRDYCQQDVKITRELFVKAIKDKNLKWHWHNKEDRVETLDTSYWYTKAQQIAKEGNGVNVDMPSIPVDIEDIEDDITPAEKLDIAFQMNFKMRMAEESGDRTMTHDQERAFLGLVQGIQQQCEMLKQLGSPIEVYDIETAIQQPLKKREIK